MSLAGTRGLVRVSKNPDCTLQTAMVVEQVKEPEFYQRLVGREYPGEYGERVSARRRGAKFEASLHANNATALRHAVGGTFGLDPKTMHVRNFEDELPGTRDGIRAHRLARTRKILKDLAQGLPVPQLVIQPQFALPIGSDKGQWAYVSPDFMVLDPRAGMYVPGEEKSFIVRQGVADSADLELTRRQAAAQVLALRHEANRQGIGARVDTRAVFVMATPYGLKPAPAVVERVDGEIHAIGRAVQAILQVRERIKLIRDQRGETSLVNLADDLPVNYRESCVGRCVLAEQCRARYRNQAAVLGDDATDVFGEEFDVDRILELAAGAAPGDERERILARQLADAAEILGVDVARLRRAAA